MNKRTHQIPILNANPASRVQTPGGCGAEPAKCRPGAGHSRLLLRPLLALWLLAALQLQAQYSIDWWTVDGGGGTSTGGVYAVTGTIGQPDAGQMSGGTFTLTGGFWALAAVVQTPGAPMLYITNAGPGWVMVWWTPPSPEFVLQVTPTLSPPIWTNAPSGSTNPILIRTVWPTSFFRLRKP
jgi:hypothetical protein